MRTRAGYVLGFMGLLAGVALQATDTPAPPKCSVLSVPVDREVTLEVLDWGGQGRPIVFLAALGADAHEFDGFATKFTGAHHVYGITRRGFGGSSRPESGYSNDRLGQDVVAVIESLHLDKPVLVGHSIAGMELSWVGTHHPERVSGLVYVEAAYGYAYYSEASSDPNNVMLDALELREKLAGLPPGGGRPDQRRLTAELLADTARLERGLRDHADMLKDYEDPVVDPSNPPRPPAWLRGIYQGMQKYTAINVPVLAIFALPHSLGDLGDPSVLSKNPAAAAAAEAEDIRRVGSQADALERGVRSARVVRIPHAAHFIFQTNEQDVLREMNAFLARLP
jgi:pimeloyl-ACP methyl ester carboxylesterase